MPHLEAIVIIVFAIERPIQPYGKLNMKSLLALQAFPFQHKSKI